MLAGSRNASLGLFLVWSCVLLTATFNVSESSHRAYNAATAYTKARHTKYKHTFGATGQKNENNLSNLSNSPNFQKDGPRSGTKNKLLHKNTQHHLNGLFWHVNVGKPFLWNREAKPHFTRDAPKLHRHGNGLVGGEPSKRRRRREKFTQEDNAFHPNISAFQAQMDQGGSGVTWSPLERKLRMKQQMRKIKCLSLALKEANDSLYDNWCPRVWDQILCWPPAAPSSDALISCSAVPEFQHEGNASRYCDASGRWFTNGIPSAEERGTGWTNYSECITPKHTEIPSQIVEWLPTIRRMSVIGYSISLLTLVVSFSILLSLRKLRCPRNILHLHLFASFMMRAMVVLLKRYLVRNQHLTLVLLNNNQFEESSVDDTNGSWWCKLVIVVWQYFILANYCWILMEGLYLHNLIFMALFSDSSAITLYIILGWGLPLVMVVSWAIFRVTLDNFHCWTINRIQWIFLVCIRIPVALSNFINFFFFLNVTRVLVLKLRSSISPESMKYRRLARSTLVLVPLFGVHYFLLWGLSTSTNVSVELIWLFLDQVFSSLQGFFVAVLYCLMNGEVRQELRKIYYRYKGEPLGNATHSTVISNTRTYVSRARTSIHSVYSTTTDRKGGQTPSPQMKRPNDGSLSSMRLAPLHLDPHSPFNSCLQTPEAPDLLGNKSPVNVDNDAIELETLRFTNTDYNLGKEDFNSEETPLLISNESWKPNLEKMASSNHNSELKTQIEIKLVNHTSETIADQDGNQINCIVVPVIKSS